MLDFSSTFNGTAIRKVIARSKPVPDRSAEPRSRMHIRGHSLHEHVSLAERASSEIEVRFNSEVEAAQREDHLESIEILESLCGTTERCEAQALVVFIHAIPPTEWLRDTLLLDDRGFILTGRDVIAAGKGTGKLARDPLRLEPSVPGVFAAGDVRHGSGDRVATAVGEGALAVISVWQYHGSLGL
jgi:thioredoxin reductase (NADPH)